MGIQQVAQSIVSVLSESNAEVSYKIAYVTVQQHKIEPHSHPYLPVKFLDAFCPGHFNETNGLLDFICVLGYFQSSFSDGFKLGADPSKGHKKESG